MVSLSNFDYSMILARQNKAEPATGGTTDESKLHEKILSECSKRGWIAFHSRMDVPSTITVGCPDFIILADGGATIYIEAKARKKKLSTEQLGIQAWAKKLDHTIHVVRSIEEFHRLCNPTK